MAYEHDHGLALTGEASEAAAEAHPARRRRRAPSAAGRGARCRSVHAEQVIRTVQQWLAALGYRVARVDGRLGEDTVKAIRDFEIDKGLVPKGRISAELVTRLSGGHRAAAAAAEWRRDGVAAPAARPLQWAHAPQIGNLGQGLPAPLPGRGRSPPCWCGAAMPMRAPSTSRSAASTARRRSTARRLRASRRRARSAAGRRASTGETAPESDADAYLARQIEFDPDIWIVAVEDRQGRHFLDDWLAIRAARPRKLTIR